MELKASWSLLIRGIRSSMPRFPMASLALWAPSTQRRPEAKASRANYIGNVSLAARCSRVTLKCWVPPLQTAQAFVLPLNTWAVTGNAIHTNIIPCSFKRINSILGQSKRTENSQNKTSYTNTIRLGETTSDRNRWTKARLLSVKPGCSLADFVALLPRAHSDWMPIKACSALETNSSSLIGQRDCQCQLIRVTCPTQHGCYHRVWSWFKCVRKQHVAEESSLCGFSAHSASCCWVPGDKSKSLWSYTATLWRQHPGVHACRHPGHSEGNHRGSAGWSWVSDMSWEHLPPGHETGGHAALMALLFSLWFIWL